MSRSFSLLGGAAALLLSVASSAIAVENNCIQDVWKAHNNSQNLTCSAKDVTLAQVSNICVGGDCSKHTCTSGQQVTFTADFVLPLTAQTRYDVGLYLATDGGGGDGAKTGQCADLVVTAANASQTFINLDSGQDACGDITDVPSGHNPQVIHGTVTTACSDLDGDGKVNIPWCTSWRQPGSNEVCDTTSFASSATWDAFPGSPSKCNCGNLNVDIFLETATIEVTKTASPETVNETGGSVTYSVSVKNQATQTSVTLDTLDDDVYGDITSVHDSITATDCTLATIAAGDTYSCQFTVSMPAADAGTTVTDTVTGCGTDGFGHTNLCDDDDATVTYTDVTTEPSLTKTATSTEAVRVDVKYTVVLTNNSAVDTLSVDTLDDDKFGDITSAHAAGGGFGEVVSTTCATGGSVDPGSNYSCTFVGRITATGLHTNRVSATATDDDGNQFIDPPLGDTADVNVSVTFP